MRIMILAASLTLALSACGGDKKTKTDDKPAAAQQCESNEDCQTGWACLDGECASTVTKDIYVNPENAVTPDKVKREIEKRTKQHSDRVDKVLDM